MEVCDNNCKSCKSGCESGQSQKVEFDKLNTHSNIKKVIGIVSGKGGVGKSLVTSLLAVMMTRKGYRCGILDADITGPSIPAAFGVHERAKSTKDGMLTAKTKTGIQIMSINMLLENEDDPVAWRGPVVSGAVKQFWSDVIWENLDFLFVDMPPGTGDVMLTVFNSIPLDGIIIVTTPQDIVSVIVSKAVNMAKKVGIPIVGLVENYSYFECPECRKKFEIFGKSHTQDIFTKFNLNILDKIPINPSVANAVDKGKIENLETNLLNFSCSSLESLLIK